MTTLTAPAPSSATSESNLVSFRITQIRTQEDFYLFCQENSAYRFERDPDGLIIVMPNTGEKLDVKIQN